MVDSSQVNTFDDWFLNLDETNNDGVDSSLSSFPPPPPTPADLVQSILSTNDSSSSSIPSPSLPNNEEESNTKKRKNEHRNDQSESKKHKQVPPYMRRNIRQLLKNDQLQADTLSAQRAEEDRLKRLEEITQQFKPVNHHITTNDCNQLKKLLNEQECIVLDDDDDDDEKTNLSNLNTNSDASKDTINNHGSDNDSNDSDVQSIDGDTEFVNDKLTKRLQRLHVDDRVNIPDDYGNVLINVNHPSDDPNLYIPKHLCPVLKPHQIGGIRFMYDNIVESLQHFQATPGLGCILAHSMGCGKTLQVITFIDIFLRHTTAKSVLIVVPINTLQNWLNEFNIWCPIEDPTIEYKRPYQLYVLNDAAKKIAQRASIVQNWSRTGGTLLIGYEMFRLLVTKKGSQNGISMKMNSNNAKRAGTSSPSLSFGSDMEESERNLELMEDLRNSLLKPDLVICDEGHRIKNHQASVAMALKSIKTKRRVVLTGYPLQNNLIEYWCMVDFVRPNYLGSKQEFCNMFERPISNGQCMDSTPEDELLMRSRSHVLHSLLEGFIQRRGHSVLQTALPPKTEYVILLKLSSIQRQLYMKFLESIGALSNSFDRTINPLRVFAICCKIWNHPDVLYKFVRDHQDVSDLDLDLDLDQNSNSTNRPLAAKQRSSSRLAISNRESPVFSSQPAAMNNMFENLASATNMFSAEKKDFDYDFANSILSSYTAGVLSNGIKFEVALNIINLSINAGDKVLVFSQSLLSLDKLEEFLSQREIPKREQKWQKNINYYRLDGATNSLEREKLINAFNAPNSNALLFLLSTRAGCLGINLVSANRVIVMDVSWNPCLDAQAVCRVYRYGQEKPCYVYRLIADFTMEKRIYDRQIAKQGMSDRVVDELQPQTQFTRNEVQNLIHFAADEEPIATDLTEKLDEVSYDSILLSICKKYAQSITKVPFTHESLLLDHKEYQLTSAEKRRAQRDYQNEKQRNIYTNRSRLNAARYSSLNNNTTRFVNDFKPRSFPAPFPTVESRFSMYNTLQTVDKKFEMLKQKGVSIHVVALQNPLEVQMNGFERAVIPAGVRIHVIKSLNGSYIRTPDGKFFGIRQSPSSMMNNPVSTPPAPQPMPPPPPPPPPPAPLEPSTSSSTYDLLDEILSDLSSIPSSDPSSTPVKSDLSNEIDDLLDDTSLLSPSSTSVFDNLNSWSTDFFQQDNFDLNLFPDQFDTSVS